MGSGHRWKMVTFAGAAGWLVALREDGTLWKFQIPWSLDSMSSEGGHIRGEQLGRQSDWIAMPQFGNGSGITLAADGSVWAWGEMSQHLWLAPSRKPVYLGNIFETNGVPE